MARVVFPTDLQRYVDGAAGTEVDARNYRDLVTELAGRYPALQADVIKKYGIAIDGVIYQQPMLQQFGENSEVVFIARIAGG